jgi:hypothetical protein
VGQVKFTVTSQVALWITVAVVVSVVVVVWVIVVVTMRVIIAVWVKVGVTVTVRVSVWVKAGRGGRVLRGVLGSTGNLSTGEADSTQDRARLVPLKDEAPLGRSLTAVEVVE